MLIPSIDLMNGRAVQLVGGEKKVLERKDPLAIAEEFRLVGEIAVIDLDRALGKGSNEALIRKIIRMAPVRVGGGIRDVQTARAFLDAGAKKVILGTKATPEILKDLPKERVMAALDARHGEVVVEGWRVATGFQIVEKMRELKPFVSGFLVTFVEREGRMQGTRLDQVEDLVKEAGQVRLTVAGGITTKEEIRALDQMGADAQVGMAIYTGRLGLAEAFCAPLRSDREDGLWPTVVTNQHGIALGLCYSNLESVTEAVKTKRGIYHSRRRGLWVKGESSGARQDLLRLDLDCDRDCLRVQVRQRGEGFCHLKTETCFGDDEGLPSLFRTLLNRKKRAPKGSYTKKLLRNKRLLHAKIHEEAKELTRARKRSEVTWEAADLLYFTFVKMVSEGVSLEAVEEELRRRMSKVTRRDE